MWEDCVKVAGNELHKEAYQPPGKPTLYSCRQSCGGKEAGKDQDLPKTKHSPDDGVRDEEVNGLGLQLRPHPHQVHVQSLHSAFQVTSPVMWKYIHGEAI